MKERRMASQYPQLTRHDLEAKIVKHSWEDEGFRREFLADPAGAFVKYLNVPAAALPKIAVHQEEPGSWHIVLPAKPVNTAELSEADLERIAGGAGSLVATDTPLLLEQISALRVTLFAPPSAYTTAAVAPTEGW
jgi:hypothetical protein